MRLLSVDGLAPPLPNADYKTVQKALCSFNFVAMRPQQEDNHPITKQLIHHVNNCIISSNTNANKHYFLLFKWP